MCARNIFSATPFTPQCLKNVGVVLAVAAGVLLLIFVSVVVVKRLAQSETEDAPKKKSPLVTNEARRRSGYTPKKQIPREAKARAGGFTRGVPDDGSNEPARCGSSKRGNCGKR